MAIKFSEFTIETSPSNVSYLVGYDGPLNVQITPDNLLSGYYPYPTGDASQYVRGDGVLSTLPTSGSGGNNVSYYFNGGTSQGIIGGSTYYQMSYNAVTGTAADFPLAGNGLISQWITDVGNPNLVEIKAGNWNFEFYMSASSVGGTPAFYVELLKYNGATFTTIANSSATPEGITGGTAIDLYFTSLAIPLTTLLSTDRLAIRVYIVNSVGGRTITMHTQDSHLCQVITNFSGGISSLNGITKSTQYLTVGTSGSNFNISSSSITGTHTFNLPDASVSARGLITTGAQTIGGVKTFDNGISIPSDMNASFGFSSQIYEDSVDGYFNIVSASSVGLSIRATDSSIEMISFSGLSINVDSQNNALGDITFNVGGSLKGIITNSGKFGINNSATSTDILQVTGDTLLTGKLNVTSTLNVGPNLAGVSGVYNLVVNGADAGVFLNRIGQPAFIRLTQDSLGGGQIKSLSGGGLSFTDNTGALARLNIGSTGNILIGTTSDDLSNKLQVTGNSKLTGNLTVTGTSDIKFPYTTKSIGTALLITERTIEVTMAITLTLPIATGNTGKEFVIKNNISAGGSVTITGTIDGAASYILSARYKYVHIICNGTNWLIIANN